MNGDELDVSIGKLIAEIANAYDPAKKEEYVETFKQLFSDEPSPEELEKEKEQRKELREALGVVGDSVEDMTPEERFKYELGIKEPTEE